MLSIGKLGPGQEAYYEREVAQGLEEYYRGVGEAPGTWQGRGAADLGLEGVVDGSELRSLLAHRDPATGEPLSSARVQPKVAGFDATFNAPKSVSLLHALGAPEISNEVRNAHDAAVAAAFAFLEPKVALARRGAGGAVAVQGDGLAAAAYRHRTSREGDPHLHTHVVIANVVRSTTDERWTALDAARGLYPWARPAGHLYEAQLRWELTRRLGVDWGPVRNGIADIDGIPRRAIDVFSKRRSQIKAHLAEHGQTSSRSAQIATYATRRAKDHKAGGPEALDAWRQRADDVGLDAHAIAGLGGRSTPDVPALESEQATALFEQLAAPDGICRERSTFTYGRAIEAVCDLLPHGAPVPAVLELVDAFLVSQHVVPLETTLGPAALRNDGHAIPSHGSEQRWTTVEMLATERRLLANVARLQHRRAGIVEPSVLASVSRYHSMLSTEQDAMVNALCRSGNGVDVVIGVAGAGKTTALAAAVEAWHTAGFRVRGAALAARTAKQLGELAGVEATTLHRLLAEIDGPRPLTDDDVVIVDEAGMVGSRSLDRLVRRAATTGSKVVLIGDPRQLPELDAGGALAALEQRTGAEHLTTNRRQISGWERSALADLRTGRTGSAVAAYQAHGRVHLADDGADVRTQQVEAWDHDRRSGTSLIVAGTNRDVDDLNLLARAAVRAAGELDGDDHTIGDRTFAVGDTVLALRNDPQTGLLNGTRARLERVDDQRRVLVLDPEGSRVRVGVPFAYAEAGHLTHGYAMTIHKAQGATVDTCHVLVGDSTTQQHLYTAMSRGRTANHLYARGDELRALDAHTREIARTAEQAVASAVARDGRQRMATDGSDHHVPVEVLAAEANRLRRILLAEPPNPARELAASRPSTSGLARRWRPLGPRSKPSGGPSTARAPSPELSTAASAGNRSAGSKTSTRRSPASTAAWSSSPTTAPASSPSWRSGERGQQSTGPTRSGSPRSSSTWSGQIGSRKPSSRARTDREASTTGWNCEQCGLPACAGSGERLRQKAAISLRRQNHPSNAPTSRSRRPFVYTPPSRSMRRPPRGSWKHPPASSTMTT